MTIYLPQSRQASLKLRPGRQGAQSEFSFSFSAETPANENHHAFGNLIAFEFCPLGLEFILFRPLSEKE